MVDVFVQTDLPIRCETTDHQLILGRRGTGKTHLIKFFQYKTLERGGIAYYSDCTNYGSGQFSATADPLAMAAKYFVALLNDVGTALLDHAVRLEAPSSGIQDKVFVQLTEGLVSFMRPAESKADSIFNYRQIADALRNILEGLGIARFFLILDEWAQIPIVAQPLVAEFVKRALLTVPAVSVKILAVNYQCKFSSPLKNSS